MTTQFMGEGLSGDAGARAMAGLASPTSFASLTTRPSLVEERGPASDRALLNTAARSDEIAAKPK